MENNNQQQPPPAPAPPPAYPRRRRTTTSCSSSSSSCRCSGTFSAMRSIKRTTSKSPASLGPYQEDHEGRRRRPHDLRRGPHPLRQGLRALHTRAHHRSWLHAEENKRRTLQKNDIAAAITRTDIFDFLVDIVPRDEIKDEAAGLGMGAIVGSAAASGVPYYYPPMGQPAAAPGMMIGRPAVPGVDPGVYVQPPPSQAWQSVWQTAADDGSYASGGSSGHGNLDGQG